MRALFDLIALYLEALELLFFLLLVFVFRVRLLFFCMMAVVDEDFRADVDEAAVVLMTGIRFIFSL